MLVSDAGKKRLESTMSIPTNMNLLEESLWGLNVLTNGGNHCKTMYHLSFTLMCFATCITPFGGISFPLRRVSAMRWLQLVDSEVRAIELQLCKTTWVVLPFMHKNNAVLILPFTAKHEPKTAKCKEARGTHL